jgi:hypothetical protein
LQQLWLFIIAPLVGAAIAGLAFRTRMLEADGPVATPEEGVEMTEQAANLAKK